MTLILAVDTSTDEASVALSYEGVPIAELSWRAGGNHSRNLDPSVRALLALAGVELRMVRCVAVAIGPGSFNGVRVGISYALGLAFGLDVPVAPVATLDVIGYQAQRSTGQTLAVIPAGRGELFFACYDGEGTNWVRDGEYARAPVAEILDRAGTETFVAGPGAGALDKEAARRGLTISLQPNAGRMRRAAYLAELGARYPTHVKATDVGSVRPLYLRPSAAEETRAARE